MARLFLAINLPDDICEELDAAATPSHALAWTPRQQLHLTLRFLGEVPREQVGLLAAALAQVRVEPFLLALSGCGTFPSDAKAQVLWIGVGSGHPRLYQLRQRIDDSVLRHAIPADLRRFLPHVTLARLRNGHPASAFQPLLKRFASYESPPFLVQSFGLYESELLPTGAVHRLIAVTSF